MLIVKEVSVSFGERVILQNVSVNIRDGEKVGLVGDNGAGKTTLLKVIVKELLPDQGSVRFTNHGSPKPYSYIPQFLSVDGNSANLDILSYMLDGRGLRKIVARIEEIEKAMESPGFIPDDSLLTDYFKLQERYTEREGYRSENDILELLSGVGLADVDPFQLVKTLSGGQKSRVALARMLYEQSDLLVMDEPTNHIDEAAYSWLCQYLSRVQQSILVVSHLPAMLDQVVDRILYLDGADRVLKSYPGNYSKFVSLRTAEMERQGKERGSISAEIERLERFIRNAPQSKVGMKHDREKVVAKLKTKLPAKQKQKKLDISFPIARSLNGAAFQARNVKKSYGSRVVLRDISLELAPTESLLLHGDNGAGKTTFLRILSGMLSPDSGTVKRNHNLTIGFYQQEQEGLDDGNTVLQEARLANSDVQEKNLRSALAHFLFFQDQINQKVGTLSRGERARLALCKIMLSGANCLLLDEPTNHLDPRSREILKNALINYQGALIIVSHDKDFTGNTNIDRVLTITRGCLCGG
ncbi:MAG: ABC-F family ATP-binding cassette domain-containing protein [Patescibacteria group bacterium]